MWQSIVDTAGEWSGTVLIAAVGIIVVIIADRLLWQRHRKSATGQLSLAGPLITFLLVGMVAVSTILSLPIGDSARGQLLGLLGLLVTAAVALSSTTFLGNAMAGIMLRAVRNFRLGDYVRVGEFAGRISDRGILHTELQTEDSDLTTLPNLYLVTHPVTVLRPEGTVVSAIVSLGYDVDHHDVERYLIDAATRSGLSNAFVRVEELGDFSITYRAAGILTEVKHLLSARSDIRKAMLDALHEAGVEIVSPNFMNQRLLAEDASFVPGERKTRDPALRPDLPDARIFDKAELAEANAKLRKQIAVQSSHVEELTKERQASTLEAERIEIDYRLEAAKERLANMIELADESS